MKRILIFSLAYYPRRVSGAEIALREITDRLDPLLYEFHMVTLRFDARDARHERVGNIMVHRVGFGPAYLSKILFIPLSVIQGAYYCQAYRIDAFWAMMTYMLFPVALLRLIGIRKPYVLTLQDGDPYEKVFGRWFIRPVAPLLNYGFRHAATVQAISHYLAQWPKRRGYAGSVEVIYNGADTNDVVDHFSERDVAALKQKLGKKDGDVYLVNTARLEPQKAFDITIRALALLPQHVSLLIVGSGREEHMLRALAQSLNLESRVRFIGQVPMSEVTLYRKVSDILVGPSRSEGLGNTFLSAMASRIPVVATREGGLAEFVFSGKESGALGQTAWVVPKDDPEAVARAVSEILAHPDTVSTVVARARALIEEKFTWDVVSREMHARIFTFLSH